MSLDLVVRGGLVVSPRQVLKADVGIKDGRIVAIGEEAFLSQAARMIDAAGLYVLPGIIDPHYHVMDWIAPGEEIIRSETISSIASGVTTIGLFVNWRGNEEPETFIHRNLARWEANAVADVFFHLSIRDPAGIPGLDRFPLLGVNSFKFLLGYRGVQAQAAGINVIDDGDLFSGFEQIAAMGGGARALVHAENGDIAGFMGDRLRAAGRRDFQVWNESRPGFVEAEAIRRSLYLANVVNCPLYFPHTTIAEGLEICSEARAHGQDVLVETCPQYLTHTSEEPIPLFREQPVFGNVNPPLRLRRDVEALWSGLRSKIVHTVGSDCASTTRQEKGSDIWKAPMGLGNTSNMILPLLLSEGVHKRRLTLPEVVEIACYNPARIFGLHPKKGEIAVGADADLVIVDLDRKVQVNPSVLQSRCDWTIYDGWEVRGWPVVTIKQGEVAVQDGRVLAKPGTGRFLPRG
ncbi:MAG: amidohydrolase family protein [Deltaproteobacteria bacterium]|nr:amidohydrolase family protein [Deltaproteobacteria bacterium]